MKTLLSIVVAAAIGSTALLAQGNGAPSGPHYNLNILGKEQCPTDPMTGTDQHTIFVLLNGGDSASSLNGQQASNISKVNKIYLTPSPDNTTFAVLDGNGCDGNGALFELLSLPRATPFGLAPWPNRVETPP